jgi:hypothetical protein
MTKGKIKSKSNYLDHLMHSKKLKIELAEEKLGEELVS